MADLVIKINGDVKDFQTALKKAQEKTEELGQGLADVAKVSGVAFAALTAEIGLSVHAFEESESAGRKLTQALQNQGIFTTELRDSYKAMAVEIQTKTGLDDDAVIAAQAQIQAMLGQQQVTEELTQAIADLSVAQGISLDSAAEMIGRGINGQVRAFKQLGIEIDVNASKQERTAQIIAGVSQRMGDQAAAANQGIGAIRGLKSAFSDVQEELGARFAPSIGKAIVAVRDVLIEIKKHPQLIDFAAAAIQVGAAVTGTVAAFASAGAALIALKATLGAIAAVATVSVGSIALIVGAVAALAAGVVLLVANWDQAWAAIRAVVVTYVSTILGLVSGVHEAIAGLLTFDPARAKAGIEKARTAIAESLDRLKLEYYTRREEDLKDSAVHEEKQLAIKKAAADRAATAAREQESRERQAKQAAADVELAQMQGYSAKFLALKRQEAEALKLLADESFTGRKDVVAARAEELRALQQAQAAQDFKTQGEFQTQLLEQNAEYQALSQEQKLLFQEQNLQGIEEQYLTEQTAKATIAQQSLQDEVNAHNQLLIEQQRYGLAYATINRAMHSEVFQGAKAAFGNLAELTQSSNAELKEIGKAAAIANIVIKTGESAMAIYAGFSAIPIIGPALGLAGAAAAIAFGAEQIGRVTGAAQGGIITGGSPGRDSVPAMLTPGELVVPTKNFDEVVEGVANQRDSRGGGGYARMEIEFTGNLVEMVEAKIVERQRLGISILGAGIA